ALSAGSQSFLATGGTGSIGVTPSLNACKWTASTDGSWVSLVGFTCTGDVCSGAPRTGPAKITFVVQPNPATTSRTAKVFIADQVFTISEAGLTCEFTVSPNYFSVTSSGGAPRTVVT